HRAPLSHATLAAALHAGMFNDRAVAVAAATWVRGHDVTEERAHLTLHLTRSPTDIAGDRRGTRLAARTLAGIAEHRGVHGDVALRPENHFAELDVDADHRVVTPFGTRARAALATAESLPKERLKHVTETTEAAHAALVAAHVVALTLVRI